MKRGTLIAVSIVAWGWLTSPLVAYGAELKFGPLPYPEINADTWVLIEIWPEVGDITLSTYFMDFSVNKNASLCLATKRALDRDATATAEKQNRTATSYRQCLTISQAVTAGYIRASE
jgi:hypothetical protein